MMKWLVISWIAACLTCQVDAQRSLSVSSPEKDNSVESELRSFAVTDGYQVNLFADETDGVANPICMRWDPSGRLWVLCTWAYPQLEPGDNPDDKLLILEDTSGDGRADKRTVFADKLNMPTGFALGAGGVYIGHGTELLHLVDTDGDGKADSRRVVLTGFGTGDTHQNINSLTWSPGGELYFCQGLHSFSRVETPWGIVRLNEHGSWRLRPRKLQLHAFRRTSGGGNPWGIAFGNWGEPFVKSNGRTVGELLPTMVSTERINSFWGGAMNIGNTASKAMIIEFAESPHLPDDVQGNLLVAGYYARMIDRFQVKRDGAGHRLEVMPPLLKSSHNAFRPVDIRTGPDGAIYIADWFNPIIGHYQASFRHPNRDTVHGRIWRVAAKGRPSARPPALSMMNAAELCEQLKSKWRWVRYQAKRRLADMPTEQAIRAATQWLKTLDSGAPGHEHHLYEALGVFESHEVVNLPLLERLLTAKDYRARAYATRVVGRWHDRLKNALALLDRSVRDEHPRVRLEAVVACSDIPVPASMVVAAKATSLVTDRFIDYALTQTSHALAPHWRPALAAGEIRFEEADHLIFVLRALGGRDVGAQVRGLIKSDSNTEDGRRQLFELLARVGGAGDLRIVLDEAIRDPSLLGMLVRAMEIRPVKPSGDPSAQLHRMMTSADASAKAAAVRLAGLWRQQSLTSSVRSILERDDEKAPVRAAAIRSLAELDAGGSVRQVLPFASTQQPAEVRRAAFDALSRIDLPLAASQGLKLIAQLKTGDVVADILAVLMQRKGAADAMRDSMKKTPLTSDDAKRIIRYLNAAGFSNPRLATALQSAMDIKPGGVVKYSKAFVDQLALQAQQSGDAVAGRKVFQASLTGCIACHQIQGLNQLGPDARGPDLTAVGAGLQTELIIESIIWPRRQIKEGFEAAMLLLKDGRMITGYVTGQDRETTKVRDIAANELITVHKSTIAKRTSLGTIMPDGLTAYLTREELRDLVAFLASLKGAPTRTED